jgi:pimeloyl-ACP methyl ester carboxylesterase
MISVKSAYKSKKAANHVVIFVPGFPGLFTNHEDLAEAMAAKLGVDTLLIQLPGLGSDLSPFSLCGSVERVAEFASSLAEKGNYESYSLFGHSWGGLVSLNVLRLANVKPAKLILLSPLTMIPNEQTLTELLSEYSVIRRAVGAEFQMESITSEIGRFTSEFDPSNFVDSLSLNVKKIRILQAKSDDVIPAEATREFVAKAKISKYQEVEDNHYFLNRQVTIPSIFDLWGLDDQLV